MNAISSASFKVPNVHVDGDTTERDNWVSRLDDEKIEVKEGTDIIFTGVIVKITGDRPLEIHCECQLSKLTWYSVFSGNTNFKLFEGNIANAPSGLTLNCLDSEGDDPGWSADEFNGKYLILSDSTTSEQSETLGENYQEFELGTGSGSWTISETIIGATSGATATVISKGYDQPNDESDAMILVEIISGTFQVGEDVSGISATWEIDTITTISSIVKDFWIQGNFEHSGREENFWRAQTTKGTTYHRIDGNLEDNVTSHMFKYKLDLVDNQIPITATIQKIVINAYWEMDYASGVGKNDEHSYSLVLTDDETDSNYVLKTFSFTFNGLSGGTHVGLIEDLEITVSDFTKYFNEGSSYFEDGYIGIKIYPIDAGYYVNFKVYQMAVKIYYDTTNYELVNEEITDTLTTDKIQTGTNFATLGVAEGDSIVIGESMETAFENIYTASTSLPNLPPLVSYSTLEKGISNEYSAISGYKFFTTLCELNAFEYWSDDEAFHYGLLSDFDKDGGTLTDFERVDSIEIQNNRYGTIEIWWSGFTDGANPVLYSTGLDNPKSLIVVRKDIYTYAEALTVAEDIAEKYSDFQLSIPLTFKSYKHIQIGYKYSFTFGGVVYTDEICRRVTYTKTSAGWVILGYFGAGHTPAEEYIGMSIGRLDRKFGDMEILELTSNYLPANSWSQITNKPSTFPPTGHVSSHELGGSDEITIVESQISDLDHYDSTDFDTDLATKSTTDLTEGSNLYYTTARVEAVIDAEIVGGQSIDNAIDALITTHTSDADAHHALVTSSSDIITVTGQALDVDESKIDHTAIANIGTKTHAEIDDFIDSKGEANGLATLDAVGWLDDEQIPGYLVTGLMYIDLWDADSGTYPDPTDYGYTSTFPNGAFFVVAVAGTTNGIAYVAGQSLIWDDDASEWDTIDENDGAFRGYLVDAAIGRFSNLTAKNVEVRGKRPWEYRSCFNFPNDTSETNLPDDWSDYASGGFDYVGEQDDFQKVVEIYTTSGYFSYVLLADGDESTGMHIDTYLWTGGSNGQDAIFYFVTSGGTMYCHFENNAGNWKITCAQDPLSTTVETPSTSCTTPRQISTRCYKNTSGNWVVSGYIDGSLACTYTTTYSSDLTGCNLQIATDGSAYLMYMCTIGCSLLHSAYSAFGNLDKGTEGTLSIGGTDITASAAELNYIDGVSSSIQTQLDAKLPLSGGTLTGDVIITSNKDIKDDTYPSNNFLRLNDDSIDTNSLQIASIGNVLIRLDSNDSSTDAEFKILTDTSTEIFSVDESGDAIFAGSVVIDGDGGSTPLTVSRANNNVGYGAGIAFNLLDSASNDQTYAKIAGVINDNTSGAEDGSFKIYTSSAGTLTEALEIDESQDAWFVGSCQSAKNSKFRATRSSSQTISSSTNTIVQFNSETYDYNGDYNTSTYRFVAPIDGVYHFDAHIMLSSGSFSADDTCRMYLAVNGTIVDYIDRYTFNSANSIYVYVGGGIDYELDADDYVQIGIYQNSGLTQAIYASATWNAFTGHLVV